MAERVEGITRILKLRPEIASLIKEGGLKSIQEFDPSPSLADVVTYYEYVYLCNSRVGLPDEIREECRKISESSDNIFIDPARFFERTYLSENMDDILVKVFGGLLGGEAIRRDGNPTTLRSRIVILPSLMGGGKTHLLITLFHLLRLYNELVVEKGDLESFKEAVSRLDPSLAERLYEMVKKVERKRIRIAAIDGTSDKSAPDPNRPEPVRKAVVISSGSIQEVKTYGVRTLWGVIAHYLGNYALMAKRDESNTVPSKEELKQLLAGDPFLIMIDEPLVYASRYGNNEKLRDFFQVLAIALKETGNGVLILSIPVSREELAGGSGIAREIYEVLSRAQPGLEIMPPLEAPEIVNVLKKRLFENSDEELRKIGKEVARIIVSKGGSVVKNAIVSVFGSVPTFEEKLEKSYPFNPLYLELLEDFFNHLKYLQRTRDAIRITIMALAAIYNRSYRSISADFYMLSPYHIPVYDSSVRSYLVNPNYSDYQLLMSMYEKDVEEASKKTSRPWLSKIIATFIWLRSIIGRGIPERQYLRLYPSLNDIILAVYDPAVFGQHNIGSGIIGEELNELYSYCSYMVVLENKYFMTQLLPIDELIKRKIREISEIEAQKRICRIVKEIFPLENGRRRTRSRTSRVFKDVYVVCPYDGETAPEDIQRGDHPVLVVFAYEPDEAVLNDYLTRNNIVVVVPSMSIMVEDPEKGSVPANELLLSYAKELSAIESITLNELKRLYGDEFARAKSSQLDNRSNEIRKKIIQLLLNQVFNRIIIGKPKWEVRQLIGSVMSGVEESAVRAVEEILVDNSFIPPDFRLMKEDIIHIAKALGKTCIDESLSLETICKEVEIGELWKWFNTTLEPPLRSVVVDFNGFLEGIKQLYEDDLLIAFRYGTKFVWKSVKEAKPLHPKDRGDWEDVKKLVNEMKINIRSLKIVPWNNIVDEYIEALRREEGVKIEGNVKRFVKIMVSYMDVFGERIDEPLEMFMQKEGWRDLVRTAVFWRVIEYPEYLFTLQIVSVMVGDRKVEASGGIKLEPNEKLTVRIRVNAKDYPFAVSLRSMLDDRLIRQDTFEGGSVKEYDITIEGLTPGEHILRIEASGRDPRGFSTAKQLVIKVAGEIPERLELDIDGVKKLLETSSYSRITLESIKVSDMARIIDLLRELRAERSLRVSRAEIINEIALRGRSENTSITIGPGVFGSFDELRALIEPLSKTFRFENGTIAIEFEELESKENILKLLEIVERSGVESVKFVLTAYKKIG